MSLHPKIRIALESFRKRRQTLIILRAALSSTAALLIGILLIAGIDWLVLVPDSLRYALSALLYLAILLNFWLHIRPLLSPQDERSIARQIESAKPSPHGQFLASVELGLDPSSATLDSPEFRARLQEIGAMEATRSPAHRILSFRKIRPVLFVTLASSLLLAVILIMTKGAFSTSILRSIAPTADLERISHYQITILQPSPSEGVFPEDEKITIEVSVSGPSAASPTLEVSETGHRTSYPMRLEEPGRFQAQIPLGTNPLEYKVRAGDALTRRFVLRPTARPHARSFRKNYHTPPYAGLAPKELTETHGNLQALFGTSVSVEIELNEEVCSADLVLRDGELNNRIPLSVRPGSRTLQCEIPVDRNATYHLALVSSLTGLSSLPSPQFEIRSEADLPPTVSLESPIQDVSLPLGKTIPLSCHAEDDLGLVKLAQLLQTNNGPWKEIPSQATSGKSTDLNRAWDPLIDGAKPGDVLTTKFIAVDSLGQHAESRSVRITLLRVEADPALARELALHRDLQQQLQSLQKETRDAATALNEFKAESESRSPDLLRRDQAGLNAQRALEDAVQKGAEARVTLAQALRNAPTETIEADLTALARLLNRIQLAQLETARDSFQEARDGSTPREADKKEALRTATEAAAQASAKTAIAAESFKALLSAEEAKALANNAAALAAEQKAIAQQASNPPQPPLSDSPKPPAPPEVATDPTATLPQQAQTQSPSDPQPSPLQRQQINEAAVRTFQKDLNGLADRTAAEKMARETLKPLREELQKSRTEVEKSLSTNAPQAPNPKAAESLEASLEKTRQGLESLEPKLAETAASARISLAKENEATSHQLEKLATQLQALSKRPDISLQTRDSQSALRLAAQAAATQADATLASIQTDSDGNLAADLNTAARALRAAAAQDHPSEQAAQKTTDLSLNLRPLEAAAQLDEATRLTDALAKTTPPKDPATETTERAAASAIQKRLDSIAQQFRKAALPETTQLKLEQALASDAAKEIKDRATPRKNTPTTASSPSTLNEPSEPTPSQKRDAQNLQSQASTLAQMLRETAESAQEAVDTARKSLDQSAPTPAEEFKRLAAEAALAGEKTARLATPSIPNPNGSEIAPAHLDPQALKDTQRQESRQSRQVSGAKESLLQEANQQNLMTEEGRQRARDSDAANALLRDSSKAAASLEKAADMKDPASQAAMLQEAAEQQKQLSKQLEKVADHLATLEKGTPDQVTKSRESLREAEKQAGISKALEASQKHAEELAQLANATASQAKEKLEQLLQNTADPSAQNSPPQNTKSKPGSRETNALQKALESLQNAPPSDSALPSDTANALAQAAKANQESNRNQRLEKSAQDSPGGDGSTSANGIAEEAQDGPGIDNLPTLSKSANSEWGKLPKRIAKDLMEGKRESPSGEYQTAIESYFRAIAERARSPKSQK